VASASERLHDHRQALRDIATEPPVTIDRHTSPPLPSAGRHRSGIAASARVAAGWATALFGPRKQRVPPVLLVTGAQRSGTTLLQTLLANALRTPVLPEAHSLRDLLACHARADESWLKAEAFFGARADLDAQFRGFACRHIDHLMAIHDHPPMLVLKDPGFLDLLASLRRLLPETPLVISLRDPRDIAASFIEIGQRQSAAGEVRTKYARRDLAHMLRKLGSSHGQLLGADGAAARLGRHTAIVHYEQLTAAPEAELSRLGRALDLPLRSIDLEALAWLGRERRHQESWVTPLEEHRPSTRHVGRFRSLLTPAEIRRIEQHEAAFMAAYGYPPEPEAPADVEADSDPAQPRPEPSVAG
jgi:hypothetical protein